MCQTTINQSTVIANISVCIAGSYVSFCYEVDGRPEVDTAHISELPDGDDLIFRVRLWLIEKYK